MVSSRKEKLFVGGEVCITLQEDSVHDALCSLYAVDLCSLYAML